MQTVPKRVFTHEYRAEAVKLVLIEGLGVTEAARASSFLLSVGSLNPIGTMPACRCRRVQPSSCNPSLRRCARERKRWPTRRDEGS